ncbi:MAG: hypothetical protein UV33_C0048G0006, partial [Candidatus Daviesbacteria bacterium GW2011_GWA1_42_6]
REKDIAKNCGIVCLKRKYKGITTAVPKIKDVNLKAFSKPGITKAIMADRPG